MSGVSLTERMALAIDGVRSAFGPIGDWGYDTPQGKALQALYVVRGDILVARRRRDRPVDDAPLEDRLADCLAAAIDTPLLTVRDQEGGKLPLDLRLGAFNEEIAERAAALLEECGK